MKRFFEPETVALIGASPKPGRPGHNLFRNLQDCFGERFYPVNPRLQEIGGKRCYGSILELPAAIDVAVVFIPAASVPTALEQCADKDVRRVIIESGGFAESGEEGRALQRRCLEIGRRAGMRLWGPNCMGLVNVRQTKVLSFMIPDFWKSRFMPGGVSLVVQSGMLSAGFLSHTLSRTSLGLSKIASIGNKMDVDETDLLEYLVEDEETAVIAMYLESIDRGRPFFELCRAARKPIVVLKAGRTSLGAQAAASHTASLAQNDAVLDGALRQAGVIRATGMNELLEVARALELSPGPEANGTRAAVIAFSGGAGVVSSDALADRGMKLAKLSPASVQLLRRVFPEWMEPANPIDLYPAIEKNGFPAAFTTSVEAAATDPEVDAVLAHVFSRAARENLDYDRIAGLVRERNKPMVVWTLGDPVSFEKVKSRFEKAGIPVVDEIDKAVRVLAALATRAAVLQALRRDDAAEEVGAAPPAEDCCPRASQAFCGHLRYDSERRSARNVPSHEHAEGWNGRRRDPASDRFAECRGASAFERDQVAALRRRRPAGLGCRHGLPGGAAGPSRHPGPGRPTRLRLPPRSPVAKSA